MPVNLPVEAESCPACGATDRRLFTCALITPSGNRVSKTCGPCWDEFCARVIARRSRRPETTLVTIDEPMPVIDRVMCRKHEWCRQIDGHDGECVALGGGS